MFFSFKRWVWSRLLRVRPCRLSEGGWEGHSLSLLGWTSDGYLRWTYGSKAPWNIPLAWDEEQEQACHDGSNCWSGICDSLGVAVLDGGNISSLDLLSTVETSAANCRFLTLGGTNFLVPFLEHRFTVLSDCVVLQNISSPFQATESGSAILKNEFRSRKHSAYACTVTSS